MTIALTQFVLGKSIRRVVTLLSVLGTIITVFQEPVVAQTSEDTQVIAPEIIRNGVRRVSGPITKEGVTGAEECGSYVADATLLRETYGFDSINEGVAVVQVVTFPKRYRYAPHDAFCSLLRTAAYDEKLSGPGDLSVAALKVRCTQWEFADGTKGGTICYVHKAASGIGPTGSVRWIAGTPERGLVSVGIGYRNLTGLPGQVIDKYLREYPSSVPENPTWHIDWETKDLEKWAEMLRASKDELRMLQVGAAYLTRYNSRSFGLLDALRKRDDAVAFSESLDEVVERISRVVAERKAESRESGQRDE
jgi:hypothetical protein